MEVNPVQARETLQDVQVIAKNMRDRLAYGPIGPILALWGLVWIVCFMISQFAPGISRGAWLIGDGIGIASSCCLGRLRAKVQHAHSESFKRMRWKSFWFWISLFVFADIWLAILWPWSPEQCGTFVVTLVMFAYVIMGIWGDMRFMLWLGVVVTALAFGGYMYSLHHPGYLNLWLGLSGGLALLGSGIYLMIRWR